MGLGGAVRLALPFALGHSLFPVVGYFAGQLLSGPVQALDHWIALILLGYIGIKMAWEAISEMRKGGEVLTIHNTKMDTKTILMQTIATSIDVLAIGIGFAAMDVNIVVAALVYFFMNPLLMKTAYWLLDNYYFIFFVGVFFGVLIVDFCHSVQLTAKIRKFAEDRQIVIKYEKLKESIRAQLEAKKEKAKFLFAFRSSHRLEEHIERYAEDEAEKSKEHK